MAEVVEGFATVILHEVDAESSSPDESINAKALGGRVPT